MIVKAASIFGAGLLTSFTPCVYPMIPITLGYLGSAAQGENKRGIVLSFFFGQVFAFTALGLLAVTLGEVLGFSSEIPAVQIGTAVFLLLFAFFSWRGGLPQFLQKFSPSQKLTNRKTLSTASAAFVGAISAIVASPCASPILGGVLASVAGSGSFYLGTFLMLLYALGVSSVFLVLGLGLVSATKMPRSGPWLAYVHKASSILLACAGGYYLLMGLEVL